MQDESEIINMLRGGMSWDVGFSWYLELIFGIVLSYIPIAHHYPSLHDCYSIKTVLCNTSGHSEANRPARFSYGRSYWEKCNRVFGANICHRQASGIRSDMILRKLSLSNSRCVESVGCSDREFCSAVWISGSEVEHAIAIKDRRHHKAQHLR